MRIPAQAGSPWASSSLGTVFWCLFCLFVFKVLSLCPEWFQRVALWATYGPFSLQYPQSLNHGPGAVKLGGCFLSE